MRHRKCMCMELGKLAASSILFLLNHSDEWHPQKQNKFTSTKLMVRGKSIPYKVHLNKVWASPGVIISPQFTRTGIIGYEVCWSVLLIPFFHTATGFLSQTLAEKHFPQTLSFSCPHKTHPCADLHEYKNYSPEILQRPNTYEAASDFRTPAPTSIGLDICTQHHPPPSELCKFKYLKTWGKLWNHFIGRSGTLLNNIKAFHFIPLFQPHGRKSQDTSAITALVLPIVSWVS